MTMYAIEYSKHDYRRYEKINHQYEAQQPIYNSAVQAIQYEFAFTRKILSQKTSSASNE